MYLNVFIYMVLMVFHVNVVVAQNLLDGPGLNRGRKILSECGTEDFDGDGVFDLCDLDDDNDGVPDIEEGNPIRVINPLSSAVIDVSLFLNLAGSASFDGTVESRVELTPDLQNQSGSANSEIKLDLTEDFALTFDLNFGTNNDVNLADGNFWPTWPVGGADGISFILHNDPLGENAIGNVGDGIGAYGIQNGLAIEFDTFDNTPFGGSEGAIPGLSSASGWLRKYDHTAIWDTDGAGPYSHIGNLPINVIGTGGEVEDGAYHTVVVSWNKTTQVLSWTFDGATVGSLSANLPVTYFNGANEVYFGFAASTGSLRNKTVVEVKSLDVTLDYVDTDGDGLPDYKDLDSDGDGCYDSYEAGVPGATNNSSASDSLAAFTAANVGANGLADLAETFADSEILNYTSLYNPNGLNPFVFSCTSPLPIELNYFNVKGNNDGTAQISWQTLSEMNNQYFTVERSKNGKDWESLETINGAGNASHELNYYTNDKFPLENLSYYRLKQTDYDGEFSYSDVVSLDMSKMVFGEEIRLYYEGQTIIVEGEAHELENLYLVNLLGQPVSNGTIIQEDSPTKKNIQLTGLPTGFYCVKTTSKLQKIFIRGL